MDGLLNVRLDKFIHLHDNLFGFTPGLSTESAILCLKQTVKYHVDRDTPIYACFLDLSKAFDLVCYDIFWKICANSASLQNWYLRIFKYWYTNQVNLVRWAGVLTDPYVLGCGVRQDGLT